MGEEYVIAELKFCILSTPLVSAVNHMTTRTFREKKTTTTTTTRRRKKMNLFFPLNLNVYINLDKLARARNNGDQFRWKKNIYSGCEKMRNASSCQGKNERQ